MIEPLDTPPDWHARIAARAAEWTQLGPIEAARQQHKRGEMGKHVLAVVEALDARGIPGEGCAR